jgi:ABC-2 type transport system permease protein
MIDIQIALIRRELWEHRAIYITPLIVALIVSLMAIFGQVSISGFERGDEALEFGILGLTNLGEEHRSGLLNGFMVGMSFVPAVAAAIVAIIYSLDALSAERKDRSILFWRSMPVTDSETVFSKLLTALLIIPFVSFAAIVVTHVLVLLISSVWLEIEGGNAWHLIWAAAPFLDNWSATLIFLLAMALWLSPFVGWFLFVSVIAKRWNFLVAFLPIVLLPMLEGIFFKSTVFARAFFVRSLKVPLFPGWDNFWHALKQGKHVELEDGVSMSLWSLMDPGRFLSAPGLWIGLIVCALFVTATIYVRRYRDDS